MQIENNVCDNLRYLNCFVCAHYPAFLIHLKTSSTRLVNLVLLDYDRSTCPTLLTSLSHKIELIYSNAAGYTQLQKINITLIAVGLPAHNIGFSFTGVISSTLYWRTSASYQN